MLTYQRCGGALESCFVWLAVDTHRIQTLVPQPGRDRRQVDSFDESSARVMAKAMWMHMLDVGAPPELSNQVLNAARCVRPTFSAKHRACRTWTTDRVQCRADLVVEWDTSMLPALANDVEPA